MSRSRGSIEVGESAKPTVFDWDGDGELDVLVGNADGDLKFLKLGALILIP